MIKKSIVAIVVMLAAAALVFGASGNYINPANTSNQAQQSSVTNGNNGSSDNSASDNSASDNTNETKITSAEAKETAQKYIDVQGATAGTPKLIKTNGQYIYVVPVINNGTNVGEIDIDAITGKNVGGAGGAP
jgi:uncharacterized membrane protein YkoI